jgi:low affinity Fe/Cu permease
VEHKENNTPIEDRCEWVCDQTGSPFALILVCVFQVIWIIAGQLFRFDPYPFSFLLTVSNIVQLILIFVLAVGQRQNNKKSELKANTDHESISYILHHQDAHYKMLYLILDKLRVDNSLKEEFKKNLDICGTSDFFSVKSKNQDDPLP